MVNVKFPMRTTIKVSIAFVWLNLKIVCEYKRLFMNTHSQCINVRFSIFSSALSELLIDLLMKLHRSPLSPITIISDVAQFVQRIVHSPIPRQSFSISLHFAVAYTSIEHVVVNPVRFD